MGAATFFLFDELELLEVERENEREDEDDDEEEEDGIDDGLGSSILDPPFVRPSQYLQPQS